MKTGKACFLACAFLLAACLIPAARAQKQDNQQNQKNGGENSSQSNSKDQNPGEKQDQPASNAPGGKASQDSNASGSKNGNAAANDSQGKQGSKADAADDGAKNPGANKSNNQQENGNPGSSSKSDKDKQAQPGWWVTQLNNQQTVNWNEALQGINLSLGNGAGPQGELNLTPADDAVREHLHLPANQGVVVNWVAPNSGAAQAGIQQNDILLTLGDSPLAKPEDLYDRLKQAGEKPIALVLLRAGSRHTLRVEPLVRVSLRPVQPTAQIRDYWIGISTTPLDPVLRAQLRLSENHKVIVNEVFAESPAAKAGIAVHDIVVSFDGHSIANPEDIAKIVQAKGEKQMLIELVGKSGKPRTVVVTPERRKATESSQIARARQVYDAAQVFTQGNSVSYDVVRPGIFLDYTTALSNSSKDAGAYLGQVPLLSNSSQNPQSAGPPLSQRLDALDARLSELLKLVDELHKTTALMVEREKAMNDSTTNKNDQAK